MSLPSQQSGHLRAAASSDPPPDEITINGEKAEVISRGSGFVTIASNAGQIEISVETHWWGFTIHLNQPAVDVLTEVVGAIMDVVCKIFPKEFAWTIELVVKIKTAWIKAVASGEGCKVISPWVVPLMLVPRDEVPKDDTRLWWAVYQSGSGWGEDSIVDDNVRSNHGPAATIHGDRIYVAYAADTDETGMDQAPMYWTCYTPDNGWAEHQRLGDAYSFDAPSLASFNGKLYCVHRGADDGHGGQDDRTYYTTLNDNGSWSSRVPCGTATTTSNVTSVVYGGRLYRFVADYHNKITVSSTADGHTWTSDSEVGDLHGDVPPAVVVYHDQIHMVDYDWGDQLRHWTSSDGSNWHQVATIPFRTIASPALVVYDGKIHMVLRGSGEDLSLYMNIYDGTSWGTTQKLPDHESEDVPAPVNYIAPNADEATDPQADTVQILLIHRGRGRH
ncbi:hypothetical protein [Spongiactinospora sp. 9N601]|uniref:hypothetical protein n=1 Tax=Spongiactinospora sp. 9N601 TaxID=3375149 RepID=UPI00379EAE89